MATAERVNMEAAGRCDKHNDKCQGAKRKYSSSTAATLNTDPQHDNCTITDLV